MQAAFDGMAALHEHAPDTPSDTISVEEFTACQGEAQTSLPMQPEA